MENLFRKGSSVIAAVKALEINENNDAANEEIQKANEDNRKYKLKEMTEKFIAFTEAKSVRNKKKADANLNRKIETSLNKVKEILEI